VVSQITIKERLFNILFKQRNWSFLSENCRRPRMVYNFRAYSGIRIIPLPGIKIRGYTRTIGSHTRRRNRLPLGEAPPRLRTAAIGTAPPAGRDGFASRPHTPRSGVRGRPAVPRSPSGSG